MSDKPNPLIAEMIAKVETTALDKLAEFAAHEEKTFFRDLASGLAAMRDGKRVDPADFYREPDPQSTPPR